MHGSILISDGCSRGPVGRRMSYYRQTQPVAGDRPRNRLAPVRTVAAGAAARRSLSTERRDSCSPPAFRRAATAKSHLGLRGRAEHVVSKGDDVRRRTKVYDIERYCAKICDGVRR